MWCQRCTLNNLKTNFSKLIWKDTRVRECVVESKNKVNSCKILKKLKKSFALSNPTLVFQSWIIFTQCCVLRWRGGVKKSFGHLKFEGKRDVSCVCSAKWSRLWSARKCLCKCPSVYSVFCIVCTHSHNMQNLVLKILGKTGKLRRPASGGWERGEMHFCDFLLHCLDRPCQIKMVPPHIAITHSRIFALDGVRWKRSSD